MGSIRLSLGSAALSATATVSEPGSAAEHYRVRRSGGAHEGSRRLLSLRVHADAFRLDPIGYLQAVVWRMHGLRVRSRSRIAALTARSPKAYALWLAREEPRAVASALATVARRDGPQIRPVIDCRYGFTGVDDTLASIAAAGRRFQPVMIGRSARSGTVLVSEPRELAHLVGQNEEWLCLLSPGDVLAPEAFTLYAGTAVQFVDARIIYADDDLVCPPFGRSKPHFKPAWNPELFKHHDYLTGAAIVRASGETLSQVGNDRWPQELIADALRRGGAPVHVPLILHHRRRRPAPLVPGKPASILPEAPPSVTIIVPTRNQLALLRTCVNGILRTTYPDLETIVVDNGSDEPQALHYLRELEREQLATVLRIPGPFNFSALNNAAVEFARGRLLCFLNNDVEITDPDWLALLVRQAVRPEIGAVGARLLYPDRTVQHAGVFTGVGGGAGHAHRLQREDEPGYFERARLPQRVSAVTGACLTVARDKFKAVGGFDESNFPVAFNDVDLCLKLNERGWQSFYEPRATLIHHESKSRGRDSAKPNRARFAGELAALKQKWHTDRLRDPYHHPHLSPLTEQFLISV